MNEQTILHLQAKFEETGRLFSSLLIAVGDLEKREALTKQDLEILHQKTVGLDSREAQLKAHTLDQTKQKAFIQQALNDIEAKKKALEIEKHRFNEQMVTLKKEQDVITEKITALATLEKKKAELTQWEEDLSKKRDHMNQQDALRQKEMIVDRTRRETLDRETEKLNKEKERIKKYLELQ